MTINELREVQDPVCRMWISFKESKGTVSYQDTSYFFCSRDCKEQFEINPVKFLKPDKMTVETGSAVAPRKALSVLMQWIKRLLKSELD